VNPLVEAFAISTKIKEFDFFLCNDKYKSIHYKQRA
jgi:hypothetical protein